MRRPMFRGLTALLALSLAIAPTPVFALRAGLEGTDAKKKLETALTSTPRTGLEENEVPAALRRVFEQAGKLESTNSVVSVNPYEFSVRQKGNGGLRVALHKTQGLSAGTPDEGQTQQLSRATFTEREQTAVEQYPVRIAYRTTAGHEALTGWQTLRHLGGGLGADFSGEGVNLGTLVRVEVQLPPAPRQRWLAPPASDWYTPGQILEHSELVRRLFDAIPEAQRPAEMTEPALLAKFQEIGVFPGPPEILRLYVPELSASADAEVLRNLKSALSDTLVPPLEQMGFEVRLEPLPVAAKVEFPGVVFLASRMTLGRAPESLQTMAVISLAGADRSDIEGQLKGFSPGAVAAVAFRPAWLEHLKQLKALVVTTDTETAIWV